MKKKTRSYSAAFKQEAVRSDGTSQRPSSVWPKSWVFGGSCFTSGAIGIEGTDRRCNHHSSHHTEAVRGGGYIVCPSFVLCGWRIGIPACCHSPAHAHRRPLGSAEFIRSMEKIAQRRLTPQKRGPREKDRSRSQSGRTHL